MTPVDVHSPERKLLFRDLQLLLLTKELPVTPQVCEELAEIEDNLERFASLGSEFSPLLS